MAQKDVHLYKLNSTVIIIRPQGEKDIGKKKMHICPKGSHLRITL